MIFSDVRRLAVITATGITAALAIPSASHAQVSGEKPTVCHGFYSHVPDGFHPNSTKKFASYPFSVEVQPRAVKIVWLDMVTEYVEKQPSVGEIVTGYDDWAFGNFRILCGDKGSVVLVADHKGEGVQTLKLSRSKGNIFTVAEERGCFSGNVFVHSGAFLFFSQPTYDRPGVATLPHQLRTGAIGRWKAGACSEASEFRRG